MNIAKIPVEGVLHVGASEGQERFDYQESGASPCIYVEPIDAVFKTLETHLANMPGHIAIKGVCAEAEGEEVSFNVSSNEGLSSSLLALGSHAELHPSVTYSATQRMVTTTVDRIVARHSPRRTPNLLVVDAQGADLRVLQGAAKSLPAIDAVFIEVSETPLYAGGCTLDEIAAYLGGFGFRLRWLALDRHGHGDAFYARPFRETEALPTYDGNLALGKPAEQSSLCEWSYFHHADGPGGAVNGLVTSNFGFHTDIEDGAWWQIDLGVEHPLREIRVFNRVDSARERSRTLQALISRHGTDWTRVHDQAGYTFGGADGKPLRILLDRVPARFVRLQLAERNYLHLDEVEIY